jgi:hypothetical protein
MRNVKRIAIIGNAGSDKLTLALQLSKITRLKELFDLYADEKQIYIFKAQKVDAFLKGLV